VQIVVATVDTKRRVRIVDALRSESCFAVGESADEAGLLKLLHTAKPDVVLLDTLIASRVNGAAALLQSVRTILLAAAIDEAHMMHALRLSARGMVPQGVPPPLLFQSIRSVLANEYWFGSDSIPLMVGMLRRFLQQSPHESPPRCPELTPRALCNLNDRGGPL